MPLRRPSSTNTAASFCLYIGNKKDHCSQLCYSRHQMCRPTAMSADHPAASDGGPVVSRTEGRSAIASPRCIPSMCFYTCATAPETRPLPAVSCAPSPRDVDQLFSSVRRDGGPLIPRPVIRALRGPMTTALPRSHSPYPLPWLF